ncbi:hypothetical protein [Kitasatospora sp. NPDC085879]|uniref:hypothetical protein n=1 Tax=Kitasatospora sp. NPDC085879 TaxID=3154769 RepID=UPI003443DD9C
MYRVGCHWSWTRGFAVHPDWVAAAADQLAAACPAWSAGRPDLLELALFRGKQRL